MLDLGMCRQRVEVETRNIRRVDATQASALRETRWQLCIHGLEIDRGEIVSEIVPELTQQTGVG